MNIKKVSALAMLLCATSGFVAQTSHADPNLVTTIFLISAMNGRGADCKEAYLRTLRDSALAYIHDKSDMDAILGDAIAQLRSQDGRTATMSDEDIAVELIRETEHRK